MAQLPRGSPELVGLPLVVPTAALEGAHEVVGAHKAELERAGHAQQIVPITGNEIGIDTVASDAVERSVVGARVDAIEARLAQIRQPRAEAVAEQHEQPEDDIRVYMDIPRPGSCTLSRTYVRRRGGGICGFNDDSRMGASRLISSMTTTGPSQK